MFVLEVGFSVVANDPISVSCGLRLLVSGGDLPVQRVVEHLEEALSQVHVSDGVDGFHELHGSGDLSVVVRPVVLEVLHVPLVDDHDHAFGLVLLHCAEDFV